MQTGTGQRLRLRNSIAFMLFLVPAFHTFAAPPDTPNITYVSIPDSAMKVGDSVTATITVDADTDNYSTEGITGDINGFNLSTLVKVNNKTYTAQFTVGEGGTDRAAGDNVPVNTVVLTDPVASNQDSYSATIVQANDPIDANRPTAFTTGGAVVTGYRTGTRHSADVTVAIATSTSPNGRTVQLQVTREGGTAWEALGDPLGIDIGDIPGNKAHSATATQVEAMTNFGEGDAVSFREIMHDVTGQPLPATELWEWDGRADDRICTGATANAFYAVEMTGDLAFGNEASAC